MSTPPTKAPSRPQSRPVPQSPRSYTVTDANGHRLLVRRPDGRPLRVRPSGSLVEADRIQSVQSYLHVPAA